MPTHYITVHQYPDHQQYRSFKLERSITTENIRRIKGVASIRLNLFSVDITIVEGHSWDDIQPKIINAIKTQMRWDEAVAHTRILRNPFGPNPYNHGSAHN